MNLELFVKEYLTCAVWVDLPEENEGLTIDNIASESIDQALDDCQKFITVNKRDIDRAIEEMSIGHVAHDFWLTRNGHGAGFWDGDYSEKLGDRLTEASKKFGEKYLYIGDDGFIYIDG